MRDHGLPAIEELKRTVRGGVQRYTCGRLEVTPSRAVVVFVTEREIRGDRYVFPPGCRTYGLFWSRRPYNCYRMHGPDGALLAHRFDVVDAVRILPDRVEYRDLLLDVWVNPDGRVEVADEDEVRAARAAGVLTPAQLRRIDRARGFLVARHGRVIREVEDILRSLGAEDAGG